MTRREFITGFSVSTTWLLAAAQQPAYEGGGK
jgi:hypothetical protein